MSEDKIKWIERLDLSPGVYAPENIIAQMTYAPEGEDYPRYCIRVRLMYTGRYKLMCVCKETENGLWLDEGLPEPLLWRIKWVTMRATSVLTDRRILQGLKDAGMDLASMVHRRLYRLHSRNLAFGVFNKEDNGFYGIREKFEKWFVFPEYHWENPSFATVQPQEDTGIDLPEDILLVDRLPGSWCPKTQEPVEFIKGGPDGEVGHGEWFYVGTDRKAPEGGCYKHNEQLFNWLKDQTVGLKD